MPFLSPNQQCQSSEGKIWHSMDLLTPSSPGGLPTLCLTTNSSWLPWRRVAMPLISPLMSVPQYWYRYCLRYTLPMSVYGRHFTYRCEGPAECHCTVTCLLPLWSYNIRQWRTSWYPDTFVCVLITSATEVALVFVCGQDAQKVVQELQWDFLEVWDLWLATTHRQI